MRCRLFGAQSSHEPIWISIKIPNWSLMKIELEVSFAHMSARWFSHHYAKKIKNMVVASHQRRGVSDHQKLDCLFNSLSKPILRNIKAANYSIFWLESAWDRWIPITRTRTNNTSNPSAYGFNIGFVLFARALCIVTTQPSRTGINPFERPPQNRQNIFASQRWFFIIVLGKLK